MHVANAIDRLDHYHGRIGALLVRTRSQLDAPVADPVALAHSRWELLRLLREYQLFKHGEIFDPQLRSGDGGRQGRAAALKSRCVAMAATVSEHTRRWTVAGTADGRGYPAEARALMTRIADHLAQERVGVVQLLDGLQRTRRA